ncbi:MAG: AI-2E family transporter [Actinomycetota bacterium]
MSEPAQVRWPPVTYWMKVTVGVLLVLLLANALTAIADILVLLLVSLVLAFGFQPALAWMERRGLKRGTSVALGLLGGLAILSLFFWLVLPDVISELSALVEKAPEYLREAREGNGWIADLNQRFDLESKLQEFTSEVPGELLGLVGSFTSFIFNSLTVLILTIYFTINLPKMRRGVAVMLGREDRQDFQEIYDESVRRVGGYVLGNLLVSGIAGVVSFVALTVIGVPFTAALAFLTAVLDLIPTIGALIAAVLASVVAAFAGVPALIATAAFYLIYQQVENYVIQPRVMGKTIEMSAPVIILAVLIGGTLLGVIGALLAIPVAAILKVIFMELYLEDRVERIRNEGAGISPD